MGRVDWSLRVTYQKMTWSDSREGSKELENIKLQEAGLQDLGELLMSLGVGLD